MPVLYFICVCVCGINPYKYVYLYGEEIFSANSDTYKGEKVWFVSLAMYPLFVHDISSFMGTVVKVSSAGLGLP